MQILLINGHHQFVFDDQEKEEIYDLYVNEGYSARALMRKYNCTMKPIVRVLDEFELDHSRGNLTSYKPYFYQGVYDPEEEEVVRAMISSIPKSKNNKYNINEFYFDDLRNKESIYVMGFLFADGSNSSKGENVSMSLEERDGYILNLFSELMHNEKPVRFIDLSKKHDFGYTYKDQYSMVVSSHRISKVLNILGMMPAKSLKLEFPRWLHPSMYSSFIRGYYDGNGSLFKFNRQLSSPQINLTITSTEQFCQALCDICATELKIRGHYYDAQCHNGITKVFTLSGPIVVQKFLAWLYKDANIFLKRKNERYRKYYCICNSLSE